MGNLVIGHGNVLLNHRQAVLFVLTARGLATKLKLVNFLVVIVIHQGTPRKFVIDQGERSRGNRGRGGSGFGGRGGRGRGYNHFQSQSHSAPAYPADAEGYDPGSVPPPQQSQQVLPMQKQLQEANEKQFNELRTDVKTELSSMRNILNSKLAPKTGGHPVNQAFSHFMKTMKGHSDYVFDPIEKQ